MKLIKTIHARGKRNKYITIYLTEGRTWAEDRRERKVGSANNTLTLTSTENEISQALQSFIKSSDEFSTLRINETVVSELRQKALENAKAELDWTQGAVGHVPKFREEVEKYQKTKTRLSRKVHASNIDSGQVLNKNTLCHLHGLLVFIMQMVESDTLIERAREGGLMVVADLGVTTGDATEGTHHIRGLALVTLSDGEAWVLDKPPLTHVPWYNRVTGDSSPDQVHEFLNGWIKANGVTPPGENFGYIDRPIS